MECQCQYSAVGAGGEVGMSLQAQLAMEWHPAVLALGLGFELIR